MTVYNSGSNQVSNLKIRPVCCTRLISNYEHDFFLNCMTRYPITSNYWIPVLGYPHGCTWITWQRNAWRIIMIKNMCMIKFDILANKGMGYNKGKIEKKKWFYVFCVTKIIFDFWASIQVVYRNIVFSYQFYFSLKLINKYETSIQVSPDHKYQINLATIFVLVCLICVDHKCSPKVVLHIRSFLHAWLGPLAWLLGAGLRNTG